MKNQSRFDTKLIHAGEPRPTIDGAISLPIFQTTSYEHDGNGDYDAIRYGRLNNTPNHLCLGEKIAAIEGTESAVVTGSGMAAITTALLAVVEQGGHLLAQDNLYGGTYHFLKENFPKLDRHVSLFPAEDSTQVEKFLKPNTKAIYVESISNPLLKVVDPFVIVGFAKKHGLLSLIDNTFPSPMNFNPASLGFDIVLHSATKYLNGHTDVIAGCIAGSERLVKDCTRLLNYLGGTLDPHACFLLNRGLKTLGVRVRAQNVSAQKLAESLKTHSRVERVLYPGLPSHPDHDRAKELFRGFGGMLSFEYKGTVREADVFLKRLKLPFIAPSLGGVETLVTRPVTTSHSGVSPEDRRRLGIRDTLVRVSVGLEDTEDLIDDFLKAL